MALEELTHPYVGNKNWMNWRIGLASRFANFCEIGLLVYKKSWFTTTTKTAFARSLIVPHRCKGEMLARVSPLSACIARAVWYSRFRETPFQDADREKQKKREAFIDDPKPRGSAHTIY